MIYSNKKFDSAKIYSGKFYLGKRVFITGHTGFKGMWLCRMLLNFGSEVIGYALEAPTKEGEKILKESGTLEQITSIYGDVRDFVGLKKAVLKAKPDIVFHLAAQPLVLESYRKPRLTYETNVMGTVNILECIRESETVRSFVNVTTDKVYKNNEWCWGYRENEQLDGFDPYSNSKSCSELVTATFKRSFFAEGEVAISTARAGNVIGGGDFARDRIIPDCLRAAQEKKVIEVRHPYSIRPYQHVLEPLSAYLHIAAAQYEDKKLADSYNIGPDENDCVTTAKLVEMFCNSWGNNIQWRDVSANNTALEANYLKLDSTKIKNLLGWHPKWTIKEAVEKTVEFTKEYTGGKSVEKIMDEEIKVYNGKNLEKLK